MHEQRVNGETCVPPCMTHSWGALETDKQASGAGGRAAARSGPNMLIAPVSDGWHACKSLFECSGGRGKGENRRWAAPCFLAIAEEQLQDT